MVNYGGGMRTLYIAIYSNVQLQSGYSYNIIAARGHGIIHKPRDCTFELVYFVGQREEQLTINVFAA